MTSPTVDVQILRLAIQIARGAYVWTVHFHNTPVERKADYRKQLNSLARQYGCLDWDGLVAYIRTGFLPSKKPPVLIALFDGYRNNHDVLLPLLDEYGLKGWFFIVTDFIDLGCKSTAADLDRLRLEWLPGEYSDGRYGMNWQEIQMIAARHIIVNHSASHHPLSPEPSAQEMDPAILKHEILDSTARFKVNGVNDCKTFTWLFGCMAADHPAAARALAEQGYLLQIGSKGIDMLPEALSNQTDRQTSEDCLGDRIVAAVLSPISRAVTMPAFQEAVGHTSQLSSGQIQTVGINTLESNVQAAMLVCSKRDPAICGIPSMLPIPILRPTLAVNHEQFTLACDFVRWSNIIASLTGLAGQDLLEKTLGCFCQHHFA